MFFQFDQKHDFTIAADCLQRLLFLFHISGLFFYLIFLDCLTAFSIKGCADDWRRRDCNQTVGGICPGGWIQPRGLMIMN